MKLEPRMSKPETAQRLHCGLRPRSKSAIRNLVIPSEAEGPKSAIGLVVLALLGTCGCRAPTQAPAPTPYHLQPGSPQAQAEQIILEGLADQDSGVRADAIEVVSATRDIRLMPKVQQLLSDRAERVRFSAVLAIGDLQYVPAEKDIPLLLHDPNASVKIGAAYAMTRLAHPEYSQAVRDAIAGQDQTLRANAALLLGKSGNQEALPLLYWTLQRTDSSDEVIQQAVESIAILRDERIYPKLWSRLISAYVDDRLAGVRAMGLLGTEHAKNAIVTMLDDPVLEVRLAAAQQLGKLGDSIGEAEVRKVFEKDLLAGLDSREQRTAKLLAALAIGEIGTPSLTKYLPKFLADPSPIVRLAAAKAVLRAGRRAGS